MFFYVFVHDLNILSWILKLNYASTLSYIFLVHCFENLEDLESWYYYVLYDYIHKIVQRLKHFLVIINKLNWTYCRYQLYTVE